jgi:hypothetical protein
MLRYVSYRVDSANQVTHIHPVLTKEDPNMQDNIIKDYIIFGKPPPKTVIIAFTNLNNPTIKCTKPKMVREGLKPRIKVDKWFTSVEECEEYYADAKHRDRFFSLQIIAFEVENNTTYDIEYLNNPSEDRQKLLENLVQDYKLYKCCQNNDWTQYDSAYAHLEQDYAEITRILKYNYMFYYYWRDHTTEENRKNLTLSRYNRYIKDDPILFNKVFKYVGKPWDYRMLEEIQTLYRDCNIIAHTLPHRFDAYYRDNTIEIYVDQGVVHHLDLN